MIKASRLMTAKTFTASGVLKYSTLDTKQYSGFKLTVEGIDQGIALLYRSLIPKAQQAKPTKYPPHISVVRYEKPSNLDSWGAYEGERITFSYDPYVHDDGVYFWVECNSDRLEEIRAELGLPPHRGSFDSFHMTIGNRK